MMGLPPEMQAAQVERAQPARDAKGEGLRVCSLRTRIYRAEPGFDLLPLHRVKVHLVAHPLRYGSPSRQLVFVKQPA
jgi:hypothetical protein